MGADEDRRPFLREIVDQIPESTPRHRIHARGRLVQEEDRRPVDHGAAQRQTLLEAEREVRRQAPDLLAKPGHLEDPALALFEAAPADAVQPGEEIDVLLHGKVGVEREELGHVADAGLQRLQVAEDAQAGDLGRARGGLEQAREHLDRRRLSGAVGPEKAEDLPRPDLEGDVIHRGERSEALGEPGDPDGRARGGGLRHRAGACVRPAPRRRPRGSGGRSRRSGP